MIFTDKYIQALKPKGKQYYVRESHGFALRILPSGAKTFLYIYTLEGTRKQMNLGAYLPPESKKLNHGTYPHVSLGDARQKYRDAANLVHAGVDPQKTTPPTVRIEPTVSDLTKLYIVHCRTHLVEKSVKHQERTLYKDLIPSYGDRLLTSIRRPDAIAIIESVASRAPGQARNLLKNARAMFTFAMHREMVEFNPFAGIAAAVPSVAPKSRDRVLSHQELKFVWKTLTDPSSFGQEVVKRALLLTLITAQRPGEVAGMHRNEIDGEWWTIPIERTKYKTHPYRVYLTPLAIQIIGDANGYLFPAPRTKIAISENSLPSLVNCEVTEANKAPYFGLPRWTPHDFRRTAATIMSEELEATDPEIDAILNHTKEGVIATYNRNKYDKSKKKFLSKWAAWLESLVGFEPLAKSEEDYELRDQ
jgi:integrase